ncbi:hypothetical protein [Comamonas endophytica]|uniref:Uncharacterized protein n=1 Tax=Comamonas endophytica TaxID=2949090 RepID=A0ABY6GFE4_9BURK|nr:MULTISPECIES: hypothetical protein [unclassified Acidovorax]MCD2513257.1 hypothetical protein [Acidovorax sp. D4N7]UYG53400.1 hypothetical protein M9799_18675 [Acidovorax sp. 5MLIR]
MNIALPALVVFACLLPGFIFRSRLKRVESISLDYSPFGRVATEAIIWAALLHLFWIVVVCRLAGKTVDLGVLLELLSSNLTLHGEALKTISRQIHQVALYFASLYVASFAIPSVIRYLITRFRADRQESLFSFLFRFNDAPWYYLLTGADFKDDEQPDMIVASAVVSIAGEAILFKGVLDSFYFKSDGSLDRLILGQTMRRPLSRDKGSADAGGQGANDDESRFYPVEGDSFVIQYDQVLTLNIQYIKLTPAEAGIPLPIPVESAI